MNRQEIGSWPWVYTSRVQQKRNKVPSKKRDEKRDRRCIAERNGLKTEVFNGKRYYVCPRCGAQCKTSRGAVHHCDKER